MRTDPSSPYLLDRHKTRLGFERAADTYDANAALQREVGSRLLERLDYVLLQPDTILDLGCGTGAISGQLLRRYKQARVIGVDLALNMVQHTRRRGAGCAGRWAYVPMSRPCPSNLVQRICWSRT
jgi:malonyl-CoA O-methyltransferase